MLVALLVHARSIACRIVFLVLFFTVDTLAYLFLGHAWKHTFFPFLLNPPSRPRGLRRLLGPTRGGGSVRVMLGPTMHVEGSVYVVQEFQGYESADKIAVTAIVCR
jgi:hypothetical protein